MTKIAVVIGNGSTGEAVDLQRIPDSWLTLGCNLIYKRFNPDYVVAIDDEAIQRIKMEVPPHKTLFPPLGERYELNGTGRRSNAGMNAMYEAIKRGYTRIYCLGFDGFLANADAKVLTGNVFSGDPLYQGQRQATVQDGVFRAEYMNWFANHFPNTEFVFVYPMEPVELTVKANNISVIGAAAFY